VVAYFFSRSMVLISTVLGRLSEATVAHTHKLGAQGAVRGLPEQEWRSILTRLGSPGGTMTSSSATADDRHSRESPLEQPAVLMTAIPNPVQGTADDATMRSRRRASRRTLLDRAQQSCDGLVLGRWGGPEAHQLQQSLLAMVASLNGLARKAGERENLKRRFIRFIFHEVLLIDVVCW